MKKKNIANILVKESISEALHKLMKKKDFHDITISELTATAGVGRVSFYRNYNSKEDVLKKYMLEISNEYWNTWNTNHETDSKVLWQKSFETFELIKPTVLLIYKSRISAVFYDYLKECIQPKDSESKQEGYIRSMYIGLLFSIYDRWIVTGMKETPEELMEFFKNVHLPQC